MDHSTTAPQQQYRQHPMTAVPPSASFPRDQHGRTVLANVHPNLPAILPPPVSDAKCHSLTTSFGDRGQGSSHAVHHHPPPSASRSAPPPPPPSHGNYAVTHHHHYESTHVPQYVGPHHQSTSNAPNYSFPSPYYHQQAPNRRQLPSIQHALPASPYYNTPPPDQRYAAPPSGTYESYGHDYAVRSGCQNGAYNGPVTSAPPTESNAIYAADESVYSNGLVKVDGRGTPLPASPVVEHGPFSHNESSSSFTQTQSSAHDAAYNGSMPAGPPAENDHNASTNASRQPVRPQIITSLMPRSYDPSPIARSASASRLDIRSLTTPTTPSTPGLDYYFPCVPTIASTDGSKRKAETVFIDDPRCQEVNISCDAVRTKIRRHLESGPVDVAEFQRSISANPKAYAAFMAQKGPYKGMNSSVYTNAFAFFKHRELNGVAPQKRRKVDKSEEEKLHNVSGVTLPGEDDGRVEVYDTCDEVRKKIRAYLSQPCITQAGFLREVAKAFPGERKLQSKLLNDFLSKKGASAGNTSSIYYGAYVFFEKVRVRDGREKTETRREMERLYDGSDGEPRGMDVRTKMRTSVGKIVARVEQPDEQQEGVTVPPHRLAEQSVAGA